MMWTYDLFQGEEENDQPEIYPLNPSFLQ